jgi:HAE1 family hydrophobic/amphiphilic exporter-1
MRANAIIRFFVDRFVLATGLFLALVLFGFLGATRLGVDLLPPFQLPVVAVTTLYPGAGPQAVK